MYKLNNENLLPIKFKKLQNWKFFVNSMFGDRVVLEPEVFDLLISWWVLQNDLQNELYYKSILKKPDANQDDMIKMMAGKWLSRYSYLIKWPSLHIIVLSQCCNHACVYCHASAKVDPKNLKKYNLDKEKAKKIVDVIFESSSDLINIEFQGWEPLLNWEIIKYIIQYARDKNKEGEKILKFSLVSNLSLMTDDMLEELIAEDIGISTSLDWDKELHDANRKLVGGSSFEKVSYWVNKINDMYRAKWFDNKVEWIATVTKKSLSMYKEIVDTYLELGMDKVFVRPLNPYGFAEKVFDKIGYSMKDFIDFYNKYLDYIYQKREEWCEVYDVYSEGLLWVNLDSDRRLNFMEEMSPCGAVLGQIAYNRNGDIYTCDEWRMIAATWDTSFKLCNIYDFDSSKEVYENIIFNEVTKVMVYSSIIDYIPGYDTHPMSEYIWVCPIYSYTKHNNPVSKYKKDDRFLLQRSVLEKIVEKRLEN